MQDKKDEFQSMLDKMKKRDDMDQVNKDDHDFQQQVQTDNPSSSSRGDSQGGSWHTSWRDDQQRKGWNSTGSDKTGCEQR